jgi:hypothetical protein
MVILWALALALMVCIESMQHSNLRFKAILDYFVGFI